MRGWVRMFKDEVQTAVGDTQFGFATPGGCVALRNEMLARLLVDPSLALGSIDLENMYGSLDIPNIEKEAVDKVARMWPLLVPWTREPREHAYLDSNAKYIAFRHRRVLIKEIQLVHCSRHWPLWRHSRHCLRMVLF